MKFDIESFRRIQLFVAEWFDAWRLFPRVMVGMYMIMLYEVVRWYMNLEDHLIVGCVISAANDCIKVAPSNQHAALVTAVIGFAAAIFGFYTKSGVTMTVPPKAPTPQSRKDYLKSKYGKRPQVNTLKKEAPDEPPTIYRDESGGY